jgi:hypothetical protein
MKLLDILTQKTTDFVVKVSRHQGISFDQKKAIDYIISTRAQRFKAITNEAREAAKEADIFGQLETGNIPALAGAALQITLDAGLCQYAEEIVKACAKYAQVNTASNYRGLNGHILEVKEISGTRVTCFVKTPDLGLIAADFSISEVTFKTEKQFNNQSIKKVSTYGNF